jgi:predicted RecA/RadA family phage recombinase
MAYENYGPTPTVASSEVTVAAGIARVLGTGERVPYTPAADTPAGTIVVSNGQVGVVVSPISANAQDWLVVEGLFYFPKSNSDSGMTFGSQLFYDSNSSLACSAVMLSLAAASSSAMIFTYMGRVALAASTTDTKVLANLDTIGANSQPFVNFTGSGTITSHSAARYAISGTAAKTLTLGAPTATTDDGKEITIISNSSFANVVSASGLILAGQTGSAYDTATAPVKPGAVMRLMALSGKWVLVSNPIITSVTTGWALT